MVLRRKIIILIVSIVLMVSMYSIRPYANDTTPIRTEMINILVKNGYAKETAEALSTKDLTDVYGSIRREEDISITTSAMEIDGLSEIEDVLSSHPKSANQRVAYENVRSFLNNSDKELKNQFHMTKSEIKAIRVIRKQYRERKLKAGKHSEDDVVAAGSISSKKLKYTQCVINNSTKKQSNYRVVLSYSWQGVPYRIGCFSDVIAVGWGGGLSSKAESGTSNYKYVKFKGYRQWENNYKKNPVKMGKEFVPNTGCKFIISQTEGPDYNGGYKAKSGSAKLTVFQSGKPKKWTKIISVYCHRTIKPGASIGISKSGPSVSITVGKAYDKTPQRSKNVKYS